VKIEHFEAEIAENLRLASDNTEAKQPTEAARVLVLQERALYGLAGETVNAILPYTEAHPAALLLNVIIGAGNMIGHNAYFRVEKTFHYLNLFAVLVGDTSRGRKGSSRSTPEYIFGKIDPEWKHKRIMSGLSSGQGLIWNVRDPVIESQPVKEKGKITGYQDEIADKGEEDKRLFIIEEEFSTVLKLGANEGNILSAVIRQAWDTGNLRTLVSGRKAHPVTATDAHISILGHITKQELLRYLDSTEQANGFGNRFLWAMVERSKKIPKPTGAPDEILEPLIERIGDAVHFGIRTGEIVRDNDTEQIWSAAYDKLTEDANDMAGLITARGAPQVMRIAAIYALLDKSAAIRPDHLMAGLALWDYCAASARFIFGENLGDPIADRIFEAIKQTEGLSITDIHDLFSRHASAAEIDQALSWLIKVGRIEMATIATGGRPKSIYCVKSNARLQ